MAYNFSGMMMGMIPEDAGILVLILFGVSIVVAVFMYKQIVRVAEDIPKIEDIYIEGEMVQEFGREASETGENSTNMYE